MYTSRSSNAYDLLKIAIVLAFLVAGLGRWAFGWGYGFLTSSDEVVEILEDKDYRVASVEKGHFKGFAGNLGNNCTSDWTQWYVVLDGGNELEVCTSERFAGLGEPRIQVFD